MQTIPYLADLPKATFFRGRVALAAILKKIGVQPGDDVAIQAFTCVAVPEAVLSVGARPIYADVIADGVTMDPRSLESVLTSRTRAIVAQHTFGMPADMPAIMDVANKRGIAVIEDCAHALGSSIRGTPVATFGRAAFFSFEAGKPLVLGLGGSAITQDKALAADLSAARATYDEPGMPLQLQIAAMRLAYRMTYRPERYWFVRDTFRRLASLGVVRGNYTADLDTSRTSPEFHTHMGRVQEGALRRALARVPALVQHITQIAEAYRARIRAASVRHLAVAPDVKPVFARYPLLAEDKAESLRRARAGRVELAEFYTTPIHPYEGKDLQIVAYTPGQCPNAESMAKRIVHLPTNEYVSMRFVDRVARALNGA